MCKDHTNKNSHKAGKTSRTIDLANEKGHEKDHEKWTRRSFLSTLGLGVLGSTLDFGNLSLQAMSTSPFLESIANSATDRVIILVQLSGGNDGLNTIIPFRNDVYYQKRPTIGIRQNESIQLSSEIGMHPRMAALNSLWDDNKMSIVHNVGYDSQNRSHSRSTDIWTSASDANTNLSTGWIGRMLATQFPNYNLEAPAYPLGVRIGGSSSVFESEFGNLGVTFGGASQFARFLEQGGFYDVNNIPNNHFGRALTKSRQVANDSFQYLEAIESAASDTENLVTYPNSSFAESLSVVARMIRGGLKTRVFLVNKGGFDTHNSQGGVDGPHARNLEDIAESIAAFYEDLESDNLANRALTMTFSEFGRTLDENGNKGTDHGSSAPVMLFGPVKGGFLGEHASLTDLDNPGNPEEGDPVFGTDYRSIYDSILKDWFEISDSDIETIIGSEFESLDIIDQTITNSGNDPQLPSKTYLNQNYPNPFNPQTTISFGLTKAGSVQLEIFDIQGRRIEQLVNKTLNAGEHNAYFNANALPSGTYIYRLKVNDVILTRKMSLIK